jgi:hypothetical protein
MLYDLYKQDIMTRLTVNNIFAYKETIVMTITIIGTIKIISLVKGQRISEHILYLFLLLIS